MHTLLTDEALTLFEDKLSQCLPDKQDDLTEDILKACIAKVALRAFSDDQNAYRQQVHYMRYNLYFSTTEVRSFEKRLKQLNQCLKYFPILTGRDMVELLSDDKPLEIIDMAKPIKYQETLLKSNYDPYETTLLEYCKFLFNLEAAAKLTAVQQKVNAAINDRKRDRDNKGGTKNCTSEKGSSTKTDKKKKLCGHCNEPGHEESECWLKPGQEHLRPSKKCRSESSSKGKASKPTFTVEQMTYLIQGAHKVANSKKKHKAPKKKNARSVRQ